MKRFLVPLLLCTLALSLVSCGGGGGGSRYNFSGNWTTTERVSEDPFGIGASVGAPVGFTAVIGWRIDQDENLIVVTWENGWVFSGTCDRKARTFTAMRTEDGAITTINGLGIDKDSMSGDIIIASGPYYVKLTWTGELLSRAVPARGVRDDFWQAILMELKKR